MLDGGLNASSTTTDVGTVTAVAVSSNDMVSRNLSSMTVVASVDRQASVQAEVVVPVAAISQLGTEERVAIVVTALDDSSLQGTAQAAPIDTEEQDAEVQVTATVSVNVVFMNGTRIPVNNLQEPIIVKLPTNYTTGMRCSYWDEQGQTWEESGLTLMTETLGDQMVCATSHLTLFAAIFRGFTNTFTCTQFTLLNQEGLEALLETEWLLLPGSIMFFSLMGFLIVVFASALAVDAHRKRTNHWKDTLFLIPDEAMQIQDADLNIDNAGEDVEAGSTASQHSNDGWLVVACCAVVGCGAACVTWVRESSALRDALDDVMGNYFDYFAELRDLLEQVCESVGCCFGGHAHHEGRLIARVSMGLMSSSMLSAARREISGALVMSQDTVDLFMEDEDVHFVLQDRTAAIAQQRSEALAEPPEEDLPDDGSEELGHCSAPKSNPDMTCAVDDGVDAKGSQDPGLFDLALSWLPSSASAQRTSLASWPSEDSLPEAPQNFSELRDEAARPELSGKAAAKTDGDEAPRDFCVVRVEESCPEPPETPEKAAARADGNEATRSPSKRRRLREESSVARPTKSSRLRLREEVRVIPRSQEDQDREELLAVMYEKVNIELTEAFKLVGRLHTLPKVVRRAFYVQTPLVSTFTRDLITPCKLRAFLFAIDILGSLMLTAVFFQASGATGRRAKGNCASGDKREQMGRLIGIGIGSVIVAGFPVSFLESLHTRGFKRVPTDRGPEWHRQLRAWKVQDRMIYTIGSVYGLGMICFLVLFLANISEQDGKAFLISAGIGLAQDMVVAPFAIAFFSPLMAVFSVAMTSWTQGLSREQVIRKRYVDVFVKDNKLQHGQIEI